MRATCRAVWARWSTPSVASAESLLVARYGYLIQKYALTPEGNCPACGLHLPGRWSRAFGGQRTSTPFLPHDRSRLSVI